jgi:hypothetical protein
MGTLIGSTFLDSFCADFNGIDEYVYVDDPSFKADNAGAFSLWYQPTTVLAAAGVESFVGYGVQSGANNSVFEFSIRRNVTLGTGTFLEVLQRLTNAGTLRIYIGTTALSAGTWYHLVFQSDGTTTQVYINGVLETLILRSGSVGNTSNTTNNGEWLGDISGANHRMTFGARFFTNAPSSYNDNRTNECIYLSRVLTSGEITDLYNGGVPNNPYRVLGSDPDWKSWWRFGDSRDDATTIYDEIGSNDLTLVNMNTSNYVTP